MNNSRFKIKKMAILAIFISIIILQNLVPFLGNIPIGSLSITLIHITVITAAIVLGPKDGMLIGAIWGLTTWIRAFVWPTSPIAVICFTNPLISVLPRILVGATSGYSYLKLKNKINNKLSMVIAAAIGSMTNTLLVLGQIYIFYHNQAPKLYSVNVKELLPYLLGVVGTNGIPEMLAAMFLVPIISTILIKIVWKK